MVSDVCNIDIWIIFENKIVVTLHIGLVGFILTSYVLTSITYIYVTVNSFCNRNLDIQCALLYTVYH